MPPHPAPSSSRSSSYSTFALAFKALLKAAAESSSYTDGSTYPPPVDEAHIASIVNGYINAKFARGGKTTMAHVGSKVDELERAAGQLKIACLPAIIARSRQLHGMPMTDPSLPSSSASTLTTTFGPATSIVDCDKWLAPDGEYLPPYRTSAMAP